MQHSFLIIQSELMITVSWLLSNLLICQFQRCFKLLQTYVPDQRSYFCNIHAVHIVWPSWPYAGIAPFQCIINSFLVGMQVALNVPVPWLKYAFLSFVSKITVTQQLFNRLGLSWHFKQATAVLALPHSRKWINVGLQCKSMKLHA